jgi:hypothetical protein
MSRVMIKAHTLKNLTAPQLEATAASHHAYMSRVMIKAHTLKHLTAPQLEATAASHHALRLFCVCDATLPKRYQQHNSDSARLIARPHMSSTTHVEYLPAVQA